MKTQKSYNIFTALRIERKELIHSSMLVAIASYNAECKNLFLDMLANKGDKQKINLLKSAIEKDNYSNWINTEHKLSERIGKKVRDRGRADIWLGNRSNPSYRVIIENKIDANDQNHQLRRYFRYLTGENRVNAGLYYLCLKDDEKRRESAEISAKRFKTESSNVDTQFYYITYQYDIIDWLKKVLELENLEDDFRKTVEQYLEVLKQITL